jgi:acyl-CoA synthetase (AMP-forming)/AMP-acid ligase II
MIKAPRVPSQQTIDECTSKGWWTAETFADVLERRAREKPDKEVFADERRRITYGQLWDEVRRCAEFLRRRGVRRGNVVIVQIPNRIEFAVVFFSLELIGAIANKISPDFRGMEVEYIARFSGARAYVCARGFKGFEFLRMMDEIRPRLPTLEILACVDAVDQPGVASFARELATMPPIADADRVRMDANEVMRMAFTSGTTGNPKGVLHSFNTTRAMACQILRDFDINEQDVILVFLPLGLNWGYCMLLQTVYAGARAVLMERFSADAVLEKIESQRITYFPTAPASLVALLNSPELKKRDSSSLRVVMTGGASAAVETIKAFQAALPKAKLIELYGMLESGFHTYTRMTDDPFKVTGTIGRVVDSMGLRLIDEQGRDVPYGQEGEIAAKGPSVHLGYLNNEAANREAFTEDGWFRSGDLAKYVDDEGNLMIVGRRKEIINRGGKKYFPREIEELLYQHPKILQVAIVGVPDPRVGEKNCMCAVLKPGERMELQEAVEFLRGRVAEYKLPEQLVIMDALPMTPTGKIRRPEIVKLVQAGAR